MFGLTVLITTISLSVIIFTA
ncbi:MULTISPECIES: hypothetical protein [Bacillus cereus group]